MVLTSRERRATPRPACFRTIAGFIPVARIGGATLFDGQSEPFRSPIGPLTLGAMQNGLTLLTVPLWYFVATA